jgi:transposase
MDGEQSTAKRRAGRPPKLTQALVEELAALVRSHPRGSKSDYVRMFKAKTGVSLSTPSLDKYLASAGIQRVPRGQRVGPAEQGGAPGPGKRYGYRPHHRMEGEPGDFPSSLTDVEWELVKDLFGPRPTGRPRTIEVRRVVNAICYVVRSGCAWRMLPPGFPAWEAVYGYFRRWSELGLFEQMHDRLRALWRQRENLPPEPSTAVMDSQSVKTSPQGGAKGYDGAKKLKGRKRHLVTDALGLVLVLVVHAANIQDRDAGPALMAKALTKYPTLNAALLDSGYAGACAERIRSELGIAAEIVRPPSDNSVTRYEDSRQPSLFHPEPQAHTFVPIPVRWTVERTHAWNDRPRRLAKDHDRNLAVSESWLWFTEARRLLRRLAHDATA